MFLGGFGGSLFTFPPLHFVPVPHSLFSWISGRLISLFWVMPHEAGYLAYLALLPLLVGPNYVVFHWYVKEFVDGSMPPTS